MSGVDKHYLYLFSISRLVLLDEEYIRGRRGDRRLAGGREPRLDRTRPPRTDMALGYGLRSQEAAVVRGMVLGDRSLIPEDLEKAFQRSGLTYYSHTYTPPRFRFSALLDDGARNVCFEQVTVR